MKKLSLKSSSRALQATLALPLAGAFLLGASPLAGAAQVETSGAATTKPSKAQAASLKTLITKTVAKDSGISPRNLLVSSVRISSLDKTYAAAVTTVRGNYTDPADVLLKKAPNGSWKVLTYGTAFDCSDAPLRILKEFKVEVVECLPSQKHYPFTKKEQAANKRAWGAAKVYNELFAMSKARLQDQLAHDGYSKVSREYIRGQFRGDWKTNALKTARAYLNLGLPPGALERQLRFEKFTSSEVSWALKRL